MTRATRMTVLCAAIAVHGAALFVVHRSMADITVRERLALLEPARIVVGAPAELRRMIGSQQCPGLAATA